jgi:histo-blood group ABO system transferase
MIKRFVCGLLLINVSCFSYNVGLLIVATGKYITFVSPLIKSARTHFCANHQVTYFVFTDGQLSQEPDIVKIEQKKLGWPYDTMMRIAMYHEQRDLLQNMDYIFAVDADMLFVDTVGDEILSDRVATLHPGYVGRRGTYEYRKQCTAYVKPNEGLYYFAGGFNGGSKDEFLKMVKEITENIYKDLEHGIIALWHDESHINRYFIDNPPTQILSPSYCYSMNLAATQGKILPYQKRLIALDKNHEEYRN